MFYYKKIMLMLAFSSLAFSATLLAINDTLENNTDGDLSVRVDYLNNTMPCTFNVFTVKKSEKINISSKSDECKIQQIEVTSVSGSSNGKASYATVENALQKTSIFVNVHNGKLNSLVVDITSQ